MLKHVSHKPDATCEHDKKIKRYDKNVIKRFKITKYLSTQYCQNTFSFRGNRPLTSLDQKLCPWIPPGAKPPDRHYRLALLQSPCLLFSSLCIRQWELCQSGYWQFWSVQWVWFWQRFVDQETSCKNSVICAFVCCKMMKQLLFVSSVLVAW